MEVTIKLDRTTGRAQFALLVNALLAAGSLQADDSNEVTGPTAAPVVKIDAAPAVKKTVKKEVPPVVEQAGPEVVNETGGEAGTKVKLFTDEDVRAKCAELKAADKMPKVKELIVSFGGTSATGVEDRTAFMAALNAL